MEVEQAGIGGVEVFRIRGRFDSTTSPAFEERLRTAIQAGATRLVLDFNGLDYVSSAGLRVVLLAAKQTRAAAGGFAVFGLKPTVEQVFRMSGFSGIIQVLATEEEALAAAGAR